MAPVIVMRRMEKISRFSAVDFLNTLFDGILPDRCNLRLGEINQAWFEKSGLLHSISYAVRYRRIVPAHEKIRTFSQNSSNVCTRSFIRSINVSNRSSGSKGFNGMFGQNGFNHFQQIDGIRMHDVLLVKPQGFLIIKPGTGLDDLFEVECLRQFFHGEQLLFCTGFQRNKENWGWHGVKSPSREIQNNGCFSSSSFQSREKRNTAFGTVALAVFLFIGFQNQGQMGKNRHVIFPTKCPVKEDVMGCAGKPFSPCKNDMPVISICRSSTTLARW